jgi:subtilisin family serine protease
VGFGGVQAEALMTRRPTRTELTAAAAAGVAQRWEREDAGAVFPATIAYESDLQASETATRLAIGAGRDCAAAVDGTLARLAARSHCEAGLRATYADALDGIVYTLGVLAFPDTADAAGFYAEVSTGDYPATGLNAMPVAGTAAALFGDRQRQSSAAQLAGSYVVLAVGGYADGRPALADAERRDEEFDPGDYLVSAVAARLTKAVTVRCGTSEWTCLAGDTPLSPPSFEEIRPYEMTMLDQIGVASAWQSSEGGGVTVAVLDTGVDPDAPDLPAGVVTVGPDYTLGADPAGYQPPHEHGTYIASIIAGRGDGPGDSQGVIGVAPEARILSVRVILDDGEPGLSAYNSDPRYQDAIGKGIYYAVAHGAEVINMSLGSQEPSAYLQTAVAYAIRKGVVVVASAGNDGTSSGFAPYIYPASFSGVIAVAAISGDGQRASFSEQNASVVLAAPGVGVMGDGPDNDFLDAEGTSPSAAIVTGVAALIKSRYPGLSPALVEQALVTTTTDRPAGGYDADTGAGEVNAAAALAAAGRLAAAAPAKGLLASDRFAAAPGPIQVTRRDTAAAVGYAGAAGGGLVLALAALALLVTIVRRGPRRLAMIPDPSLILGQPAVPGEPAVPGQPVVPGGPVVPDPSAWGPETWTRET